MTTQAEIRVAREATVARLASAYQRREFEVFEKVVRPDMSLTLRGRSRLAGGYQGYEAFGRYSRFSAGS